MKNVNMKKWMVLLLSIAMVLSALAGCTSGGSGSGEADSLYRVAEEKAIKANKPYNTATILYHRSQLKSTPKNEVADLKARCRNAFELMGLPNNAKRCAE